jgi:hypothetical protein
MKSSGAILCKKRRPIDLRQKYMRVHNGSDHQQCLLVDFQYAPGLSMVFQKSAEIDPGAIIKSIFSYIYKTCANFIDLESRTVI